MTINPDDVLQRMTTGLWKLANMPPSQTLGKTGGQRTALGLLLGIRGGAGFVASRGARALEELERRGIWVGSVTLLDTLRELAGLELQRRRLTEDLAGIQSRIRPSTNGPKRSKNPELAVSVSSSVQ